MTKKILEVEIIVNADGKEVLKFDDTIVNMEGAIKKASIASMELSKQFGVDLKQAAAAVQAGILGDTTALRAMGLQVDATKSKSQNLSNIFRETTDTLHAFIPAMKQTADAAEQNHSSFQRFTSFLKSRFVITAESAMQAFQMIGQAIVSQVANFAQLEVNMVNAGNLFDSTKKQVAALTGELIQMSRDNKMIQPLNDLSGSIYTAISSGVEWGKSLKFVKASADLATAGVTNMESSTSGLTSVMNAYKISFDEADKVANKLFRSTVWGNMTVEQLNESIGNVAPTAAATGISLSELISYIAAMTLQGISASQSTTALNAALSNVLKPSDQARKVAKGLGIEFNSTALAAKGLTGFLQDVIEKTGGNVDAMTLLFGSVESLKGILAVTGDDLKKVKEIMADVEKNTDSMGKAVSNQAETMSGKWKSLKNELAAFGADVLTVLSPALKVTLTIIEATISATSKLLHMPGAARDKLREFRKEKIGETAEETASREDAQSKKTMDLIKSRNERLEKFKNKEAEKEGAAEKKRKSDAADKIVKEVQDPDAQNEIKAAKEKAERELAAKQIGLQEDWIREKQIIRGKDYSAEIAHLQGILKISNLTADAKAKIEDQLADTIIARKKKQQKDEEKIIAETLKAKEGHNKKDVENSNLFADSILADQELSRKYIEDFEARKKAIYDDDLSAATAAAQSKFNEEKVIGDAALAWGKMMIVKRLEAVVRGYQADMGAYAIAHFYEPTGWAAAAGVAGLEVLFNEGKSAIMKAEKGGTIPGTSFNGDKVPVMMNSGEMAIPKNEKDALLKAVLKPGSNGNGNSEILSALAKIDRSLNNRQQIEIKMAGMSNMVKGIYETQKSMLRTGKINTKI